MTKRILTKRILLGIFMLPLVALLLPTSVVEARPRLEPVYKPASISVKGMSKSQVKQGIKRALYRRGWTAKKINNSLIRATYIKASRKTSLKAVINIHYTNKSIRIKYYSSKGFSYDKGAGAIHRRFNSWVKNVEKDIKVEFNAF
ncbi:MAG: hypothetical protein ACC635_06055 [Acidiferrobacterales bacterium]